MTRILSGIPLLFVLALIAWCVVDSWEEGWWAKSLWKRAADLGRDAEVLINVGKDALPEISQLQRTLSSVSLHRAQSPMTSAA